MWSTRNQKKRKESRNAISSLFEAKKVLHQADLCANPDSAHRGATNTKVIHLIVALQLRNTVEICFLIHSPGMIGHLFFTSWGQWTLASKKQIPNYSRTMYPEISLGEIASSIPILLVYINEFLVFHICASSLADQHIPWFRDGDKSNLVTGIKLMTFVWTTEVEFSLLLLNWIWQCKCLELLNPYCTFTAWKHGQDGHSREMQRVWALGTSHMVLVKSISATALDLSVI